MVDQLKIKFPEKGTEMVEQDMLVMERLDSSLDDILETVPNVPLPLKR